jgi:rare lipoprotein A
MAAHSRALLSGITDRPLRAIIRFHASCGQIATHQSENAQHIPCRRSSGHRSAFFYLSDFSQRGGTMSSISCTRNSHVSIRASHIRLAAPTLISAGPWRAVRLCAVALTAATLAACAQSPVVTNKSSLRAASRQILPEQTRSALSVTNRRATGKHAPSVTTRHAAGKQNASYGLASFYSYDSQTASGEKFDPNKLTAAHRTLPFGTRLRVTSVATGRSVTVRINDRGPYIPGRVIDLSYAAADTLGIVERGVTKVKMSVVQ